MDLCPWCLEVVADDDTIQQSSDGVVWHARCKDRYETQQRLWAQKEHPVKATVNPIFATDNCKPSSTLGYAAPASAAPPQRVTVESLTSELHQLAAMQAEELAMIDKLLYAVNATMFGPPPTEPKRDVPPPPSGMRDLVAYLHDQRTLRDKMLAELAHLLVRS